MAAPLAALPAAQAGAQAAVKVLSTDIVTLKGRVFRRLKVKEPRTTADGRLVLTKGGRLSYRTALRYEPIEGELKLNPVGIGVLGVGAALAGFLAFGRIHLPPLFPGAPEADLYKGPLHEEWEAWKRKKWGVTDAGPPPEDWQGIIAGINATNAASVAALQAEIDRYKALLAAGGQGTGPLAEATAEQLADLANRAWWHRVIEDLRLKPSAEELELGERRPGGGVLPPAFRRPEERRRRGEV